MNEREKGEIKINEGLRSLFSDEFYHFIKIIKKKSELKLFLATFIDVKNAI
jgi:hypothetical protein